MSIGWLELIFYPVDIVVYLVRLRGVISDFYRVFLEGRIHLYFTMQSETW